MFFRLFANTRLLFGILCLLSSLALAQSPPGTAANSDDVTTSPNLAATQEAIEMRYRRFEGTLLQLSEYLRKSDPSRAELLLRASGKSKEGRIPDQLQHLTGLLKKDQLGDAVERQEMVVAELQSLLELLMSEARKDDLDREKKRIQELIKDVSQLIGKETEARANTERGANNTDLQCQQKQVADSTKKLVNKIESQDAAKKSGKSARDTKPLDQSGKPNDPKTPSDEKDPEQKNDSDSPDGDKPPTDESKEDKADDGDKSDSPNEKGIPKKDEPKHGSNKPSDTDESKKSKAGKGGEPSDKNDKPKSDRPAQPKDSSADKSPSGKPQTDQSPTGKPQSGKSQSGKPKSSKSPKGKPQQGKPQEGSPKPEDQEESQDQESGTDQSPQAEDSSSKKPEKTAGRDEIERAKKEMDRAIEELKKNNKKNASDQQDKAIAELMKAKEKLEEILRQLREEERELVLAQLESRFRDMLLKQEAVNNATLAIHAVPFDQRNDRHRNRSVELARTEDEISLLAAKALTLLREEGSSVAFPEAVEQIQVDMQTVARRLDRVDVGEITQNIEQDIVEGLKEIIEALQKEQEKRKEKKSPPQQQQEQQQQQKGLVEQLAELKMLRSLQYRVNRRTKQLGRLVDGEQALDPDVVGQLKQLSDRQAKLHKATYDLSTKKNE